MALLSLFCTQVVKQISKSMFMKNHLNTSVDRTVHHEMKKTMRLFYAEQQSLQCLGMLRVDLGYSKYPGNYCNPGRPAASLNITNMTAQI